MSTLYDLIYSNRKIDKSALDYKLHQLRLAEKSDLRMQNSVQQRFRAKYGFMDDIQHNQAADVRMYRTHNPGFCYHRDGQRRTSDIVKPTIDRTNYQEIVDLLFTNGEVDCEKILCLHALSTHPCGPLMSPCKSYRNLPYLAPEQSRMETIHDRSRNQPVRHISLPVFILNLNHQESKSMQDYNKCLKENCQLSTRLYVHKPITLVIQIILEALQESNSEKISQLLSLAKNKKYMQEIVTKPELQDFLQSLNKQKFIWSSESYQITWPVMCSVLLHIENATDVLIKLVRKIRFNVYKRKENFSANSFGQENQVISYALPSNNFDNSKGNASDPEDKKYKFNVEKMAILLNNKVREAYQRDMKELRKSLASNSSSSNQGSSLPSPSTSKSPHNQVSSVISPSTTGRKKFKREQILNRKSNKNLYKAVFSDSTQYLTNIIDKECKKMEEMEDLQKHEKDETNNKTGKDTGSTERKASFSTRDANARDTQYYSYATVNNQNLGKIKHEISVKENRKRVKKFLDEPLFEKNYTED